MARPSKLTPEVHQKIVELVRAANTVEVAAETAGISQPTFYGWMARGKQGGRGNAAYARFREDVEQARIEAESLLVLRVQKAAAKGSWNAAAWLLERRWPERWSSPSKAGSVRGFEDDSEPADPFAQLDELAPRRENRTTA